MLEGKNILVIGARAGGYGESIAKAAVDARATVFGTSLTPDDPKEQDFFKRLKTVLIDVPLRYDADKRPSVLESLDRIKKKLRDLGVTRLDAVIHTVAGGFPRHPSVMKAVGDILKGKQTFFDLATAVKRNVYYVNAQSFEDTANGLSEITDAATIFMALTYRGDLPYFISHTKRHLERLATRLASQGKRTVLAALPEAWTQSSQFFAGIEIAVIHNYLRELSGLTSVADEVAPAFLRMKRSLQEIDGFHQLLADLKVFLNQDWSHVSDTSDTAELSTMVRDLFTRLRNDGTFHVLRAAVEVISDFVREASGIIVIRELVEAGRFQPGDVRQIRFRDLSGLNLIGNAEPRQEIPRKPSVNRRWLYFERDEIRATLSMYGENFLFVDRVVMEDGDIVDGKIGFGRFTVPTPEQNPILRDHFVGMPLFGGHLQMEAVAQFGVFMLMKALRGKRMVPILTGTEFPDLNTLAPPGETLTMVGIIRIHNKRDLRLEAFIENRFARSKGTIRGMIVTERVFRKMMASFRDPDAGGDDAAE